MIANGLSSQHLKWLISSTLIYKATCYDYAEYMTLSSLKHWHVCHICRSQLSPLLHQFGVSENSLRKKCKPGIMKLAQQLVCVQLFPELPNAVWRHWGFNCSFLPFFFSTNLFFKKKSKQFSFPISLCWIFKDFLKFKCIFVWKEFLTTLRPLHLHTQMHIYIHYMQ